MKLQTYTNASSTARNQLFNMMDWNMFYAITRDGGKPVCEHSNPQVGDGVTMSYYTDSKACTVVKRTATTVIVQRDDVTRLTQPKFVSGGFAGHCTNQRDIEYSYAPDPKGACYVFTRRKNGKWVMKGETMRGGLTLFMGRNEFYDYNF